MCIRDRVTGAPIETMAYEEVEYWPEIKEIFDWARTHVTSTPVSYTHLDVYKRQSSMRSVPLL